MHGERYRMAAESFTTSVPKWRRYWDRLTSPSPELSTKDREKARLFAAIMVIGVFSAMGMLYIPFIIDPISNSLDFMTIVMTVFVIVMYWLSRSQYYQIGAVAIAVAPGVFVLMYAASGLTDGTNPTAMYFTTFGVIVASLLLNFRYTVLVTVFGYVSLLLNDALLPLVTFVDVVPVIGFLSLTAVTVSIGLFTREYYERQVDEKVVQLEEAHGKLAEALTKLQVQVEETEEARQAAERANEVKSAFLASMSHELRTPLNSVINFTKFVHRGVMGPVTERQKETLAKVIHSGHHLLALINDVLDMSKIESGSLSLFIEDSVNVNEILDTAVNNTRALLMDKPVEIHTVINADLPLLKADRKRIFQVMLNILSNAAKFTEEGNIEVRAERQGDDLLIAIEDTGPGIAAEDYERVFSAFTQTDVGANQGGGTGLGMPISRSLVEAHGGKLWFDSIVGQGTTFFVSLPIPVVETETHVPA